MQTAWVIAYHPRSIASRPVSVLLPLLPPPRSLPLRFTFPLCPAAPSPSCRRGAGQAHLLWLLHLLRRDRRLPPHPRRPAPAQRRHAGQHDQPPQRHRAGQPIGTPYLRGVGDSGSIHVHGLSGVLIFTAHAEACRVLVACPPAPHNNWCICLSYFWCDA